MKFQKEIERCKHGLIEDQCAFCVGLIKKSTINPSRAPNLGWTAVKVEIEPYMERRGRVCVRLVFGDMQSKQYSSVRYT